MSQSRRQRRQMAKQFGLLGKNESFDEMRERIRRAQQMGQQIHLKNLENNKNSQIEAQRAREVAIQEEIARNLSTEKEDNPDDTVKLNTSSFNFLKDVNEGPQASGEKETKDNA